MKLKVVLAGLLLATAVGCNNRVSQLGAVSMSGATPGQKGRVRVSLANPADGAQKVSLTWSGVAINSPPSSVTIPSGETSVDLPYTAGSAVGGVAVTAKLGNDSAEAAGEVVSNFTVSYFTVHTTDGYDEGQLNVGSTTTLLVQLNAVPPTDTQVTLSAVPAGIVTLPGMVVVPAFQSQALFTATGLAPGSVDVTGKVGNINYASTLEVREYADYFYVGGNASVGGTLEIELQTAATSSDTVVALTSSNPAVVNPPATVTLPAGQTYIYLYPRALASGYATLSAVLHGKTYTAMVRISDSGDYYYYGTSYPSVMEVGVIGYLYADAEGHAPTTDGVLSLSASSVGVVSFAASTPWPAGQNTGYVYFTAQNPGATQLALAVEGHGGFTTGPVTVVDQAVPTSIGMGTPKVGVGSILYVSASATVAKDSPVTFSQSGAGHLTITGNAIVPTGNTQANANVVPDTAGTVTLTATLNGHDFSQTFTITP